jgi:uncharacterized membrane protein YhhN
MSKLATWLFGLLAISHLLAEYFSHSVAIYATKPLLLLSLAFIFHRSINGLQRLSERWLIAGLFFSCGGDVFLMFSSGPSGSPFFISGLSSFLIAHICYILAFYHFTPRGIRIHLLAALLFYVIAISLVIYLWPALDSVMRIVVSVYALTISTMGIFAYGSYQKLPFRAATFLLLGAMSFIFSDSIIALNKFGVGLNIWMPRITIMSSYILAQFLIVSGAILASSSQRALDSSGIAASPNR